MEAGDDHNTMSNYCMSDGVTTAVAMRQKNLLRPTSKLSTPLIKDDNTHVFVLCVRNSNAFTCVSWFKMRYASPFRWPLSVTFEKGKL